MFPHSHTHYNWHPTLGANVSQPETSPTTMGIEPGTFRFQIRQTLHRVAIKATLEKGGKEEK
ncbi:hypothetical protein DPMN_158919 [Dreissena polymorpha]|uniref:Uncharacterized protein n=1 Tax=Dreissena polymorpha TaxID=45954 RepID=A0A9D4EKN2_DREPO|nr:hypothetical protein DPMN_158919 [Dreissena polymorpha]